MNTKILLLSLGGYVALQYLLFKSNEQRYNDFTDYLTRRPFIVAVNLPWQK